MSLCYYLYLRQGEEEDRQPEQTRTLLKTLYLLTSVPVNVYILNNDDQSYFNLLGRYPQF